MSTLEKGQIPFRSANIYGPRKFTIDATLPAELCGGTGTEWFEKKAGRRH
jgi:hypothetical protein